MADRNEDMGKPITPEYLDEIIKDLEELKDWGFKTRLLDVCYALKEAWAALGRVDGPVCPMCDGCGEQYANPDWSKDAQYDKHRFIRINGEYCAIKPCHDCKGTGHDKRAVSDRSKSLLHGRQVIVKSRVTRVDKGDK